jgi:hypothetical protein
MTTKPHRCDERCTCPVHGTDLIYWPAGDDHACQDVTCVHGHGMRAAIEDAPPPSPITPCRTSNSLYRSGSYRTVPPPACR